MYPEACDKSCLHIICRPTALADCTSDLVHLVFSSVVCSCPYKWSSLSEHVVMKDALPISRKDQFGKEFTVVKSLQH